ncbi:7,8-didemethyl-8-hydroxy-5-deazariboflavin synthase subunit CofH [Cyanobacterium sp. uoEpiScrs1]|uniref:7,8-didemethyl-8-hydroxy-5-deazariboflavin synthase subunit CofH n=1 Tax=Cyanobacterium sp. uoEpiScrs1 TaxID=2976343 RepID=UPI002269FB98|nr:7,8-didemethyl-8-hydroxy-5-deazariboflavin synthase subunit CofH [Cyanobacterium sp. uoEpiScrs1]
MTNIDVILDKVTRGIDLLPEEGIILLTQTDKGLVNTIRETADKLRRKQVGDTVTYVINCNINFTNICEQHCNFCAFRRNEGQIGAFWLRTDQILEKAAYAFKKKATEICIQGGLNPQAKLNKTSLDYYLQLVKTLKKEFPKLHLHAFSPQEIQFIAREDNVSYSDVIIALRDAGLGSIPGTAAEVLDDNVRRVICPEKVNTQTWLEIVSTAHRLGIPTTSTMLSGHIETPQQQIRHLIHLRNLQKTAIKKSYPAKITEFVLLPFVGKGAPQPLRKRVGRDQPILGNNLLLTAVARIMLGNWIPNHQPSWVKLGLNGALKALQWGCNDIGGTLMEENITLMAGAKGGTYMEVETLQKAIQSIHRPYQQRDTIYSDLLSIPNSN